MKASQMFCQTTEWVARQCGGQVAILLGWSVWMTTSAVSMVASEPRPPLAMPTSARATHRGVVHAVAYEGQLVAGIQVLLHVAGLVFGQQAAVSLCYAQLGGYALHDAVLVAREHDELGDTVGAQLLHGAGGVGLGGVGHGEVAGNSGPSTATTTMVSSTASTSAG